MDVRESIAQVAAWSGWRRFGPAAGSLATHAVLGAAFVTLLASAQTPMRMGAPQMVLDIELLAEAPPADGKLPTPPDARATPAPAPDKEDALLLAEQKREKKLEKEG